ncbi:MAG: GCN5-related N-acetyltransferase [Clostridia bacterium]|jgi:GNAT superfamily N-acetyltransferase|nr:GCN5-related N-acetyltransferase [Clostridia bacterium]
MMTIESEEIVVRKAEIHDIGGIAPLCSQLGYPCTFEEINGRINELMNDDEHVIYVAVNSEGNIVGWIHSYIYKLFYAERAAEIGGLVVDEFVRRLGVGRKLMKAVEEWARLMECVVLGLRSNSKRVEAHKFYQDMGYEKVKEQYRFMKHL